MDVAKLLGVIIGATLLAFGLAKVIPIMTLAGFVILAASMLLVAATAMGSSKAAPRENIHS